MEKKLLKKFEKMDADERKKVLQVLKEKSSSTENTKSKIDWLYKEQDVDKEEYLLGRRIDKAITKDIVPELVTDVPGALFSEVINKRSEMDMWVKMKEDPLYAIRQKEEEMKRKLLENPLKMKKIQNMIESQKESLSKKHMKNKKKIKHKHKNKKKHNSSDISSNESSNCEDNIILKKYLEIVNKKKSQSSIPNSNYSMEKNIDELQNERKKKFNVLENKSKRTYSSSENDTGNSVSDNDSLTKKVKYGLEVKSNFIKSRHEDKPYRHKSPLSIKTKPVTGTSSHKWKKKLTDVEKEKKRLEMMENAVNRDKERVENVQRYRINDEHERKMSNKDKEEDPVFLKSMLIEHASKSSVEDRIKRNIHNIQRTKHDLNKKFTKAQ